MSLGDVGRGAAVLWGGLGEGNCQLSTATGQLSSEGKIDR